MSDGIASAFGADDTTRIIGGDVLTGKILGSDGWTGFFDEQDKKIEIPPEKTGFFSRRRK